MYHTKCMAHKTKAALHIIALAGITFILAGTVLFIPKMLHAPKTPEAKPIVESKLETPAPVVMFFDLNNNDRVQGNQIITGKAPGYYFFEGSFPVTLIDINGTPFATVIAKTKEDWTVTKTAHFSIKLPETFTYTGVGSILFKKDDPSDGEAPFDPIKDQRMVPVIFEN